MQGELLQGLLLREIGEQVSILLSMPRHTSLPADSVTALVDREVAPMQKITFGSIIASGGQGSIYECFIGETKLAAKRVPRREQGIQEAEIMEKVGAHKNIVPLQKKILRDNEIILVMPLFQSSLRTHLSGLAHAHTPLSMEEVVWVFGEIVEGIEYLHSQKIAHRDLKVSLFCFVSRVVLQF
jgi:serine/threonine protein kinase